MIFRCRPGILTAAAFVLIAAALTRAQGQPPLTFGTGIEVINLTVTVTDAQGRLVAGLERDAFSVFEDGVKQELALFNKDRLPLSVVLLIGASLFFVWISARIYRVGILMYGKKVTLKELGKWMFYKD